MQLSTSIETDSGEMIVKQVSVPVGLEELMEGLTKQVLLKKPKDMYVFAAEYFAKLLELRDKGAYKGTQARKTQFASKQTVKDPLKSKTNSGTSLLKKLSSGTAIVDNKEKTKSIIDKRKSRNASNSSNESDKKRTSRSRSSSSSITSNIEKRTKTPATATKPISNNSEKMKASKKNKIEEEKTVKTPHTPDLDGVEIVAKTAPMIIKGVNRVASKNSVAGSKNRSTGSVNKEKTKVVGCKMTDTVANNLIENKENITNNNTNSSTIKEENNDLKKNVKLGDDVIKEEEKVIKQDRKIENDKKDISSIEGKKEDLEEKSNSVTENATVQDPPQKKTLEKPTDNEKTLISNTEPRVEHIDDDVISEKSTELTTNDEKNVEIEEKTLPDPVERSKSEQNNIEEEKNKNETALLQRTSTTVDSEVVDKSETKEEQKQVEQNNIEEEKSKSEAAPLQEKPTSVKPEKEEQEQHDKKQASIAVNKPDNDDKKLEEIANKTENKKETKPINTNTDLNENKVENKLDTVSSEEKHEYAINDSKADYIKDKSEKKVEDLSNDIKEITNITTSKPDNVKGKSENNEKHLTDDIKAIATITTQFISSERVPNANEITEESQIINAASATNYNETNEPEIDTLKESIDDNVKEEKSLEKKENEETIENKVVQSDKILKKDLINPETSEEHAATTENNSTETELLENKEFVGTTEIDKNESVQLEEKSGEHEKQSSKNTTLEKNSSVETKINDFVMDDVGKSVRFKKIDTNEDKNKNNVVMETDISKENANLAKDNGVIMNETVKNVEKSSKDESLNSKSQIEAGNVKLEDSKNQSDENMKEDKLAFSHTIAEECPEISSLSKGFENQKLDSEVSNKNKLDRKSHEERTIEENDSSKDKTEAQTIVPQKHSPKNDKIDSESSTENSDQKKTDTSKKNADEIKENEKEDRLDVKQNLQPEQDTIKDIQIDINEKRKNIHEDTSLPKGIIDEKDNKNEEIERSSSSRNAAEKLEDTKKSESHSNKIKSKSEAIDTKEKSPKEESSKAVKDKRKTDIAGDSKTVSLQPEQKVEEAKVAEEKKDTTPHSPNLENKDMNPTLAEEKSEETKQPFLAENSISEEVVPEERKEIIKSKELNEVIEQDNKVKVTHLEAEIKDKDKVKPTKSVQNMGEPAKAEIKQPFLEENSISNETFPKEEKTVADNKEFSDPIIQNKEENSNKALQNLEENLIAIKTNKETEKPQTVAKSEGISQSSKDNLVENDNKRSENPQIDDDSVNEEHSKDNTKTIKDQITSTESKIQQPFLEESTISEKAVPKEEKITDNKESKIENSKENEKKQDLSIIPQENIVEKGNKSTNLEENDNKQSENQSNTVEEDIKDNTKTAKGQIKSSDSEIQRPFLEEGAISEKAVPKEEKTIGNKESKSENGKDNETKQDLPENLNKNKDSDPDKQQIDTNSSSKDSITIDTSQENVVEKTYKSINLDVNDKKQEENATDDPKVTKSDQIKSSEAEIQQPFLEETTLSKETISKNEKAVTNDKELNESTTESKQEKENKTLQDSESNLITEESGKKVEKQEVDPIKNAEDPKIGDKCQGEETENGKKPVEEETLKKESTKNDTKTVRDNQNNTNEVDNKQSFIEEGTISKKTIPEEEKIIDKNAENEDKQESSADLTAKENIGKQTDTIENTNVSKIVDQTKENDKKIINLDGNEKKQPDNQQIVGETVKAKDAKGDTKIMKNQASLSKDSKKNLTKSKSHQHLMENKGKTVEDDNIGSTKSERKRIKRSISVKEISDKGQNIKADSSQHFKENDKTPKDDNVKTLEKIAAVIRIQALWRGYKTRKTSKKSNQKKEEMKMADAVIKIQALWRGFNVRRRKKVGELFGKPIEKSVNKVEDLQSSKPLKEKQSKSALKIQSLWRGYQVRKNIKDVDSKLAQLQHSSESTRKVLTDDDIMKAATKIQANVRGYFTRKNLPRKPLMSITEENIDTAKTDQINQTKSVDEPECVRASVPLLGNSKNTEINDVVLINNSASNESLELNDSIDLSSTNTQNMTQSDNKDNSTYNNIDDNYENLPTRPVTSSLDQRNADNSIDNDDSRTQSSVSNDSQQTVIFNDEFRADDNNSELINNDSKNAIKLDEKQSPKSGLSLQKFLINISDNGLKTNLKAENGKVEDGNDKIRIENDKNAKITQEAANKDILKEDKAKEGSAGSRVSTGKSKNGIISTEKTNFIQEYTDELTLKSKERKGEENEANKTQQSEIKPTETEKNEDRIIATAETTASTKSNEKLSSDLRLEDNLVTLDMKESEKRNFDGNIEDSNKTPEANDQKSLDSNETHEKKRVNAEKIETTTETERKVAENYKNAEAEDQKAYVNGTKKPEKIDKQNEWVEKINEGKKHEGEKQKDPIQHKSTEPTNGKGEEKKSGNEENPKGVLTDDKTDNRLPENELKGVKDRTSESNSEILNGSNKTNREIFHEIESENNKEVQNLENQGKKQNGENFKDDNVNNIHKGEETKFDSEKSLEKPQNYESESNLKETAEKRTEILSDKTEINHEKLHEVESEKVEDKQPPFQSNRTAKSPNKTTLKNEEVNENTLVNLPGKVYPDESTEKIDIHESKDQTTENIKHSETDAKDDNFQEIVSKSDSPHNKVNSPLLEEEIEKFNEQISKTISNSLDDNRITTEANQEMFLTENPTIPVRELPDIKEEDTDTNDDNTKPIQGEQIRTGGDGEEMDNKTNQQPVKLIHSSEFHDSVTTRNIILDENQHQEQQGTVINEENLPLTVQLTNQATPGVQVLTSSPMSGGGGGDDDVDVDNNDAVGGRNISSKKAAQASNKDVSPSITESEKFENSPTAIQRDMDNSTTEKRNHINNNLSKKNMEVEAATKIQAGFRGYQVRKQLKNKHTSSTGDISNQRRLVRRKSSGQIKKTHPAATADLEERSAVKIQAGVRGFLVRRRQKKEKSKDSPASSS